MCISPQGRRSLKLASLLYFTVLVLLCISGCKPTSTATPLLSPKKSPLTVNVFKPERTERPIKTASYFGRLEPKRSITMGFSGGGRLKSIVKIRERIEKSEIIAALETDELDKNRSEIQGELDKFSGQVVTDSSIAGLENQIAALDQEIQKRKLLAPFDCYIENTFSNEGNLVGAQTPIVRIVEAVNPRVQINLPRRISDFIYPNEQYFFVLGGQTVSGILSEKALTENPPGSISVWFDVQSDLSNIEFAFGQSVEGSFSFETDSEGYWIPMTALRGSSTGLWTVLEIERTGDANIVRQKLVDIQMIRDGSALVADDLSSALVIRDGIHRVVAGQSVETNLITDGKSQTPDTATADVTTTDTATTETGTTQ